MYGYHSSAGYADIFQATVFFVGVDGSKYAVYTINLLIFLWYIHSFSLPSPLSEYALGCFFPSLFWAVLPSHAKWFVGIGLRFRSLFLNKHFLINCAVCVYM